MYSCIGYFLGYCQVIKSLKSESDAVTFISHVTLVCYSSDIYLILFSIVLFFLNEYK